MSGNGRRFRGAGGPVLADLRPILRSEPAVPLVFTVQICRCPSMGNHDPLRPLATGSFAHVEISPPREASLQDLGEVVITPAPLPLRCQRGRPIVCRGTHMTG
jgi:hypothetical protein